MKTSDFDIGDMFLVLEDELPDFIGKIGIVDSKNSHKQQHR